MAIVRAIEDAEAWAKWVAERPKVVQDMIAKYPPDRLYRINSGHRVTLYSYGEDGTVTVDVSGEYNRVLFGRRVFGVPITELVECELPAPGEDIGDTAQEAGYTDDDIKNILIPKMKEAHRANCNDPHCDNAAHSVMENRP